MIISKLEAARRQLETAVNLYFHEGDLEPSGFFHSGLACCLRSNRHRTWRRRRGPIAGQSALILGMKCRTIPRTLPEIVRQSGPDRL